MWHVWTLGTTVLIAFALAVVAATPSMATTAEDRSATHAYLVALEQLDETELANLPRSVAAIEALANRIAGECPGALTGAPAPEREFGLLEGRSQAQPSARIEAERQRQFRQRGILKLELSTALTDAVKQSNREAVAGLIGAISSLRWRDPRITLFVHLLVTGFQEELDLPTPAVCADIGFWVASGYKTLSTASKELASRLEGVVASAYQIVALASSTTNQPFPKDLTPFENAADRALARHTEVLTTALHKAGRTREISQRLEAALGLPAVKPIPVKHYIAKKATVVDRGRTAAGGRFVVWVRRLVDSREPPRARPGCTAKVTIEEPSRTRTSGILDFGVGVADRCLSRSHVKPEQSVECASGLLTVAANLQSSASSARLLLSDGHTITTPAIRVPAHLGGPASLYYQAIRGPSPIPVSLTELDAHGNSLAVLKLQAVVECTKHLIKYFPGGIVTLAHGNVPQGSAFTIRGEHYRELGHIHFDLKLQAVAEERLFGISGGGRLEEKVEEGIGFPAMQLFSSQASTGCTPQPYTIIYGVLRPARDTVLAMVGGSLVPLSNVTIPVRMHAGGVLAYGAFSPIPTELLIRDPHGKTVASENLGEAAKTDTETCEGEAEG